MHTQITMPEQLDGRRQRSEASRERIVKAMLALVAEGDVCPGAESVAARAGVGLRTVFRHFENMESLYQQISAAVAAEVKPMADEPYRAAGWAEQLMELIERRADRKVNPPRALPLDRQPAVDRVFRGIDADQKHRAGVFLGPRFLAPPDRPRAIDAFDRIDATREARPRESH